MKSVFSRITHHASRITHHASRITGTKKSSILHWLLAILFILFTQSLIVGQTCDGNSDAASSQNFTTLKNAIPKTKLDANFGKVDAEIPRIKDIIGVNALSTDDAGFENYTGIGVDGTLKSPSAIFKHIRVFTPSNKDFRYTHPTSNLIKANIHTFQS